MLGRQREEGGDRATNRQACIEAYIENKDESERCKGKEEHQTYSLADVGYIVGLHVYRQTLNVC